jgi:hypothetical protein
LEVWGGRSVLLLGAAKMAICQTRAASVGTAMPDSHISDQVLTAFVFFNIVSLAISCGPVAGFVTGEIYLLEVHTESFLFTTASNRLFN